MRINWSGDDQLPRVDGLVSKDVFLAIRLAAKYLTTNATEPLGARLKHLLQPRPEPGMVLDHRVSWN
jgi:hypothetical protein